MMVDSLNYRIDEELAIVKADHREFAVHYATYRENIFFRQSWERKLAIIDESDPCYWVMRGGQRIGCVCIAPNSLYSLFLQPPNNDMYPVLAKLKRLLMQWSDLEKPIYAYDVLPHETPHYLRLGFVRTASRRAMIRPTERFVQQDLGAEFVVEAPALEQLDKLAHIFFEAYSDTDSIGYPTKNTLEQQKQDLNYYFTHNKEEILQAASSVVIDKASGEVVAVCLVSLWEDIPLIANIAVTPQHRSKQIATKLMKKALTVLSQKYDVVRLFVTSGNPAESLYYNLGFHPGTEQTTFILPHRKREQHL